MLVLIFRLHDRAFSRLKSWLICRHQTWTGSRLCCGNFVGSRVGSQVGIKVGMSAGFAVGLFVGFTVGLLQGI